MFVKAKSLLLLGAALAASIAPSFAAQAAPLQAAAAETVIAETADGTPQGFALFFQNFSTWTGLPGLYLEDLYVTPAARGAGVGKALLRHLADIAVTRGYARFEWSVLDWNQPAIDFYRAMGAVGMEEWTVQRVTGDALLALAGR